MSRQVCFSLHRLFGFYFSLSNTNLGICYSFFGVRIWMNFLYKMEKLEELLAQRIRECYYFLAEAEFFFFRAKPYTTKVLTQSWKLFFFNILNIFSSLNYSPLKIMDIKIYKLVILLSIFHTKKCITLSICNQTKA